MPDESIKQDFIHTGRDEDVCRICGYRFAFLVREVDEDASFDICPCCRGQVGVDDYTMARLIAYRAQWLANGGKWLADLPACPPNWDREAQMKNIPPEFL